MCIYVAICILCIKVLLWIVFKFNIDVSSEAFSSSRSKKLNAEDGIDSKGRISSV